LNLLKIENNQPEVLLSIMGSRFLLPNDRIVHDEIKTEGENKYRFLNLFSFEGDDTIPEAHREFFLNMLSSIVKKDKVMNLEGICAVNIFNYPGLILKDLINKFEPKYICLWGIEPETIGVSVKLYGGKLIGNSRLIRVESLDVLSANSELQDKTQKILLNLFGLI
jgi:hypothetical protein